MSKTKKKKSRIVLIAALLIAAVLVFCFGINRWQVVITMHGDDPQRIEFPDTYEEKGAEAVFTGTILSFVRHSLPVITEGEPDTEKLGTSWITYKADLWLWHGEAKREVIVEDTTAPVIHLNSIDDYYTLPNHPYKEEGYTCVDNHDGDLTEKVETKEEDGLVYYTITDSSGNTAQMTREIVYDDRNGPVITLDGGKELVYYNGTPFHDSYSASDDADGDVTDKVTVEGSVDTSVDGDYKLTYRVKDSWGNESTAVRIVHVKPRPVNDASKYADASKLIYLTFDDGPGQYTEQLLEILNRYKVKATFFTTSAYPAYAYCMKKEAQAGHTVAVHSATHNYAQIYASEDAYWADFNRQNDVIEKMTGKRSTLFRFPGGSSNTVSASYNSGIMTRLAAQAQNKGYVYFDWNVTSGDAGTTTNTETVYNNVVSAIQANSKRGYPSVVLQHDVKGFSVNAVERIILWGLDNGYVFLPLSEGSPTAHHTIAN